MEIHRSYDLSSTVAAIYAAWISEATVITPATAMEIDPVVGGQYRLIMGMETATTIAEGRFEHIEENRRLRYTWEWNNDGDVSVIDVTFTKIPAGTRIDIHHSGFDHAHSAEQHAAGWDSYIEGLSEFMTGHQQI